MKHLPLISSALYCQPWAILPQNHAELGSLYRAYLGGTLPAVLDGSRQVSSGVGYHIDRGSDMALVSIAGVIGKRIPEMPCGPQVADLAVVDAVLGELAADDRIATVVLYFNTPGGSVIGLQETAELIREIAEAKRVVGYADVLSASAGYYLMAACDEIYAAPSALIGSIGTYIAALDDTRRWEMEGLALKLFRVGNLKAIGHPGKGFTAEEETYLQQMADDAGREFRDWVSARRPGIELETMQGQTFFGKSAPTALIDGLYNSLDALLADLMI